MNISILRNISARLREYFVILTNSIPGVLFALAGLLIPVMLSAAQADAPRGAAAPMREEGPDYSSNRLVGTINSGKSSGAVFENAAGEQKFYYSNKTFSDGSRIIAVYPGSIIVRTPEGSVVEYMVTRGTSGKPGAAQPGLSVAEPPAISNQPAAIDGEGVRNRVPKRKRVRPNRVEEEE